MYQKKLDEDIRCPLEYGISLLGGKWKSRILCVLGNSVPMRFGELKSEMVNITDGVLGATLNELISEELVEKVIDAMNPQMIRYSITEKGNSLIPLLRQLCRWAGEYYNAPYHTVMQHCRSCEFYSGWSSHMVN